VYIPLLTIFPAVPTEKIVLCLTDVLNVITVVLWGVVEKKVIEILPHDTKNYIKQSAKMFS